MSRPISYTSAVTFIPVSYADGVNAFTKDTSYPITNAYTNSNSSNYARLTLPATASISCQIIFEFDSSILSTIPSIATINSVTGKVKYLVNNTSRVASLTVQLYSGTTPKGTGLTTKSTGGTVYNLTAGTWTASEIQEMHLSVSATRSTSTQTARVDFYGADITINYTVNSVEYEVTISNSTTIATDPTTGTTYVFQNEDQEIKFNTTDVSNITVTDDGNVVALTPVYIPVASSATLNPTSYDNTNSNVTTAQNTQNACNGTGNTTYATFRGTSNSTYYVFYDFTIPSLPNNAVISSVTCEIKACSYSTYYWAGVLCEGTTEISERSMITASSQNQNTPSTSGIFTINSDHFTLSNINNLKLKLTQTVSGRYYFWFYGANLTINYTVPGSNVGHYSYTISNISADHTIVVRDAVVPTGIKVKVGGVWKNVVAVYKKGNNGWGEPLSNPKSAFDAGYYKTSGGTLYIGKNG